MGTFEREPMSKPGLGIAVGFALLGIGVGALVLYWATRHGSLEGVSTRLFVMLAALYCGPALLVSMGGAFFVARSFAVEHAGYVALLGGVLSVVLPIVMLVATSSMDSMRRNAELDFERSRRVLFESVSEVDEIEVERSGDELTIRLKLRSRRAFDLRAEVSVLAYGPGWSGYVDCSSTHDFSLVPSEEHVIVATCEQPWMEIEDAHTEVRVWLQERAQAERTIHLSGRTLRVPGLCPARR